MTPAVTKPRRPGALTRTRKLLTLAAPKELRDGYIDLLGDDRAAGDSAAQRTMNANWLPVIYERLWRPIGFRILGAGRSMGQEEQLMRELLDAAAGRRRARPRVRPRQLDAAPGEAVRRTASSSASTPPPRCSRARSRTRSAPNVAYVRGDAERLPFADETFDAVSCFAALYLVDDAEAVMEEMARVVSPAGGSRS